MDMEQKKSQTNVRNLLALHSFSKAELLDYITRALELKAESQKGIRHCQLQHRTIALVFDKPSTRTRVSFEAAMYGMGGQVIFLSSKDTQLARSEPLKDMARVMSRYVDGLVIRTFGQEVVEELARYATVPVINALTDRFHPCQVLSDLMTVCEHKPSLEGLRIAWIGDGNNMAHSWIEAAAILGFHLTLACPKGFEPDRTILQTAQEKSAGRIVVTDDPQFAADGADVLNTDVWTSMGQEDEADTRLTTFRAYTIDDRLLRVAKNDAIVLHCLPAHRGEEISDAVLEGPQCVAFDQAENKMHMHKAVLERHLRP